jgi:hypothetical protein
MKFLVGSGYTRFADEVEKRVRMKGFWAVVAVDTSSLHTEQRGGACAATRAPDGVPGELASPRPGSLDGQGPVRSTWPSRG